MKLDTFICEAINDIVNGVHSADESLRKDKRGQIWTSDIYTKASDMATLGLLKSGEDTDKTPLLAIQFDINVALETDSSLSAKAGASAGAKVLSVVGINLKGEGNAATKEAEKHVHKFRFCVPVKYQYDADSQS
jgi:hypothetical protein